MSHRGCKMPLLSVAAYVVFRSPKGSNAFLKHLYTEYYFQWFIALKKNQLFDMYNLGSDLFSRFSSWLGISLFQNPSDIQAYFFFSVLACCSTFIKKSTWRKLPSWDSCARDENFSTQSNEKNGHWSHFNLLFAVRIITLEWDQRNYNWSTCDPFAFRAIFVNGTILPRSVVFYSFPTLKLSKNGNPIYFKQATQLMLGGCVSLKV